MFVFKGCYYEDPKRVGKLHPVVVMLSIPQKAKINHNQLVRGEKYRTNEAKVVGFADKNGLPVTLPKDAVVRATHNRKFVYRLGATVRPRGSAYHDSTLTCAPGIHFFLDPETAYGWAKEFCS